ncbi:hypothetical protein [Haloferula sp. A504]|uniref:hypothetical protein n=1 Tax=Haloferula sp. A504 TaxID=3373601 RepID=UPI0031C894C2|nr:hypothetical protein [Verrucomicrobiaceae bacterium E54]
MKRRLHLKGNESLDLMLDTLSNVFGGIILIACLLALIPRHDSLTPILEIQQTKGEMLERRLAAAKGQLEKVLKMIADQEDAEGLENPELAMRRQQLRELAEQLREEKKIREDAEYSDAEFELLARSGDPEEMEREVQRLKRLVAEAEGKAKSIEEKSEFLTARLEALKSEVEDLKDGIREELRFPRERRTAKGPFPVIVWSNSIYPLHTGADFAANPAVRRLELPESEGFLARPIMGSGIEEPSDSGPFMAALRKAKEENLYVTIYLYPDSHKIFRKLKSALFEAGIAYGIEFVERDQNLAFGPDGTKPPEL